MAQAANTAVVAGFDSTESQKKGPVLLDPQLLRHVSGGVASYTPQPSWGVAGESNGTTTQTPQPSWA